MKYSILTACTGLCFWLAGPAEAQFNLCNKSNEQIYAAIGYTENSEWVAEGWWNLMPGGCAQVIGGPLANRYYYIRGEGVNGTIWAGPTTDRFFFCTYTKRFLLADDKNCKSNMVDRERFQKIDTGNNSEWTQNFTN